MEVSISDIVKECDNFATDGLSSDIDGLQRCYTFKVNGCDAVLGYMTRGIVGKIQWTHTSTPWSINHHQRTVTLATPATATADMCSRVLKKTLKATQELGVISLLKNWRNETFPVYGPGGEVLLEIERCASALFGVVTYGVQLVCYVTDGQGPRLWIGKRSERKQTYPGMLDSTAAGGLGAGTLPIEALVSEAQEEASIPGDIVKEKVRPMTPLIYFHIRGNNAGGESGLFQPEVEYTHALELDSSVKPKPWDFEVDHFSLYTVEEVLHALRQRLFKPNSAIVVIELLMQLGVITPENEPDYSTILSHFYRTLDFPTLIQSSLPV